jgi:cell division protein FtsQ
MERLLAAAPALFRGTRSSRARRPSSARGARSSRRRPAAAQRAEWLALAPGVLVTVVRSSVRAVWARRRLRIAALVSIVCAPLLGGGWIWLRHSSLVSVRHVRLSGVTGHDAGAIRSALVRAARGMSTLDVKVSALRAAVAGYPIVREVHANASFPHTLRVSVVEQPPVAALVAGGARTAVAADGAVLGPALLSSSLPSLTVGSAPPRGGHVGAGSWQGQALAVLGDAPGPLAKQVQRVYSGSKGLTVVMPGDLLVYFGDAERARAKWLALASVMSQEHSDGISYVDVRVPERAAAGFASGVAPATTGTAEAESSSETSSTGAESGAALAEGLRRAGGEENMSGEEGRRGTAPSSEGASEEGSSGEGSTEGSEASSESSAGGG